MTIPFRPLNTVHEIMNQIGFEPGYAYDDLVFANDAVFIIQFDPDAESKMKLFINKDCEQKVSNRIQKDYISLAKDKDITVTFSGTFELVAKKETEKIDIVFSS